MLNWFIPRYLPFRKFNFNTNKTIYYSKKITFFYFTYFYFTNYRFDFRTIIYRERSAFKMLISTLIKLRINVF